MKSCTSHHHACVCREHKVAVLIKCSVDLAAEVDSLKAYAQPKQEEHDRIQDIVERTYDACEQLQPEIWGEKEAVTQP